MRTLRSVRIVLFDPHLMCLESLAVALDDDGRCTIVGTTTTHDQLAALAEHRHADICVLDIPAGDAQCLAVIADLSRRAPSTRIIGVVDELPAGFVREALSAGIRGFVTRGASVRTLRHTINRVLAGESPVGAETLLRAPTVHAPAPRGVAEFAGERLTEREYEVLDRMIAGEDTRHIAAALQISRSTARTHVQNIRFKMGARTRLQAVAYVVGTAGRPPQLAGRAVAQ